MSNPLSTTAADTGNLRQRISLKTSNVRICHRACPNRGKELDSTLLSIDKDQPTAFMLQNGQNGNECPCSFDQCRANEAEMSSPGISTTNSCFEVRQDVQLQSRSEGKMQTTPSPRKRPLYFHPISTIYGEAFKMTPIRVDGSGNQPQSSSTVTARQVVARLSLFIHRFRDTMRENEMEASTSLSPDHCHAILWCLYSYGWMVYEAHLRPPTFSFCGLEQHPFWILVPPSDLLHSPLTSSEDASDETHFILDFDFAELFRVARPTESFEFNFQKLRKEFVGILSKEENDVDEAIRWIGKRAKESLEQREMAVGPWRECAFMQSCFASGMEIATPLEPGEVSSESMLLAKTFLKKDNLFLQALSLRGTSPAYDPNGSCSDTNANDELSFEKETISSPSSPISELSSWIESHRSEIIE